MKNPRVYLEHILQNIAHVERIAAKGKQHFLDDPDAQAAILYYLHTLAESAARLPEALQATQPHIQWAQIRGFRNVVVHDYLSVDLDRVWGTIENNLPELRIAVTAMLASIDEEPDKIE